MTSRPSSKQTQSAGENSTQVQAGQVVLVQGVTEQRAAEIAEYKARQVIGEYAEIGRETAENRINSFDSRLVAEFAAKGLLATFADPGFQTLLHRAQVQAAATDADQDHELLTKLLAERAEAPKKAIHLATSRAIDAIDSLDEELITAQTVIWYALGTASMALDPVTALASRDPFYAKVLAGCDLPTGTRWLDSLNILNMLDVSFSKLQTMIPFETLFLKARPGYGMRGLTDSEAAEVRAKLVSEVGPIFQTLVVDHPFAPGKFRINVPDRSSWTSWRDVRQLNPTQFGVVQDIIETNVSVEPDSEVVPIAAGYIDNHFAATSQVRKWYNGWADKVSLRLTPVGAALAYSNAKRFDDLVGLPSLPQYLDSQ